MNHVPDRSRPYWDLHQQGGRIAVALSKNNLKMIRNHRLLIQINEVIVHHRIKTKFNN